jgi:hypothetical protein
VRGEVSAMTFAEVAKINVNEHTERKGNLTYLSWAWAVDQLLRLDPSTTWEYHDPQTFGQTMMVSCTVHAFGKSMRCHLPVMDNRNAAIANPNAFHVNTAMMRCLAKAIALHGLGLYIYAGEDLPMEDEPNGKPQPIPEGVSKEEKERNAHTYLKKTVFAGTSFKTKDNQEMYWAFIERLKATAGEGWPEAVLQAEQEGCITTGEVEEYLAGVKK